MVSTAILAQARTRPDRRTPMAMVAEPCDGGADSVAEAPHEWQLPADLVSSVREHDFRRLTELQSELKRRCQELLKFVQRDFKALAEVSPELADACRGLANRGLAETIEGFAPRTACVDALIGVPSLSLFNSDLPLGSVSGPARSPQRGERGRSPAVASRAAGPKFGRNVARQWALSRPALERCCVFLALWPWRRS